jgi:hypothetical protein
MWLILRFEHVIDSAYRQSMEKMFDYRKAVVKSTNGKFVLGLADIRIYYS